MTTLISWNVNGIRAAIKKGFLEFVDHYNPDILCLQETKAHPEQVDMSLNQYGYHYWNSATKKGYSGTAVFSKIEPVNVTLGMGIPKHDDEGRVITVEFEKVFLVTVYTPNSQNELRRLDYRTKEWDADFRQYVKDLERTKPVLIGGDLNVAHKEIDLANPKTNTKNAGFTPEERESFDTLLNEGFVDTFRMFHEGGGHYTWWSYRARARERNVGWRIDYFCASKSLRPNIKRSEILNEITGSDHCPVLLEVDDLI